FGPAVQSWLRVAVPEAELGGEYHAVAERFDRFAEHFLVERAVRFGRVEERDTVVERRANLRDAMLPVNPRTIAVAQAHATESDFGHARPVPAELAGLHWLSPSDLRCTLRNSTIFGSR